VVRCVRFVANEATTLEADDATAQRGDDVRVVRCYQYSDSEPIDVHQELHDLPADERVEVSGWLIGNEQLWIANNGACDSGALLFAAREFRRVAIGETRQANNAQGAIRCSGNELWCRPGYLKGKGDVLANGSAWQETKVLKDNADSTTKLWYFTARETMHRETCDMHFAGGWKHVTNKEPDER
jgi:hypothetical protein